MRLGHTLRGVIALAAIIPFFWTILDRSIIWKILNCFGWYSLFIGARFSNRMCFLAKRHHRESLWKTGGFLESDISWWIKFNTIQINVFVMWFLPPSLPAECLCWCGRWASPDLRSAGKGWCAPRESENTLRGAKDSRSLTWFFCRCFTFFTFSCFHFILFLFLLTYFSFHSFSISSLINLTS